MQYSLTNAEDLAILATKHEPFAINLEDLRRKITEVLSQFGRNNFFSEYTLHDYSHIHGMLQMLDWVIPDETKRVMTSADWLMTVLSIYFHDLGLVITEDEYRTRDESDFAQFCRDTLFGSDGADDYQEKVDRLSPEIRERFLYQEFVRFNHAKRVRTWIEGAADFRLGNAHAAAGQVSELLSKLDEIARRDLALICESHHLDDLDDTRKYKVSQPYGNSVDETANVQYAAIILRTVDLLQITRQRSPSVIYKLINPTDPISQEEWAKQNAVRAVRPKPARNKEGEVDAMLPSDTVEVFATFKSDNGFFGLTSYLHYVGLQLQQSYDVTQRSHRLVPKRYFFPWRRVDDSNVDAEGFLKETFGFELDQARILDLLTGHTLYNDTRVVIRELVQNAIDAVRLQAEIDKVESNQSGRVLISWNSERGELEITDNGTGMTQHVIQQHLLRVGSSRYQDPKFREQFPHFSPISRFGIGVLSSFMVADAVEIITVSPEEEQGRQISLRSVHGKYLIRLLDKQRDPQLLEIGPHGTRFRLRFRPSAKRVEILNGVRTWVRFPRCAVLVGVDNAPLERVGDLSPGDALKSYLGERQLYSGKKVSVKQHREEGIDIAYALEYDPFYRDWHFLSVSREELRDFDTETGPMVTCVEGIAVEFGTPGLGEDVHIIAAANATGPGAPKTNVARSSFEDTKEKTDIARRLYAVYFMHVRDEIERLRAEEMYSLTWAVDQAPFLAGVLIGERASFNEDLKSEALRNVPMYLLEAEGRRSAVSLAELQERREFLTIESQFVTSVENMIREARRDLLARDFLSLYYESVDEVPVGDIVCNLGNTSILSLAAGKFFEPKVLRASREGRRLDVRWGLKSDDAMWVSRSTILGQLETRDKRRAEEVFEPERSGRRVTTDLLVPLGDVTAEGLDEFIGAVSFSAIYLTPKSQLVRFFRELYAQHSVDALTRLLSYLAVLETVVPIGSDFTDTFEEDLQDYLREAELALSSGILSDKHLFSALVNDEIVNMRVFDPFAWSRRR